jgi:hypothetical protein
MTRSEFVTLVDVIPDPDVEHDGELSITDMENRSGNGDDRSDDE